MVNLLIGLKVGAVFVQGNIANNNNKLQNNFYDNNDSDKDNNLSLKP